LSRPAALARKKGPELHRLNQQSKRVDSLMAALMEEAVFRRFRAVIKTADQKNIPIMSKCPKSSFAH